MRYVMSALPAFWREAAATMLQYRGEIALWALWGMAYPLVAMAAMSSAVEGSASGADIQGYTPGGFGAYFLLAMIVGHICAAWDVYEMGWLVRTGRMSPHLMRPLLPIWHSVAHNVAYKVVTLALLIPLWGLVAWIAQPTFGTRPMHVVVGVPAVLMAAVIHYIWGYNLALCAFWWTRMDAVSEIWWGMNLFFAGRLFPIEIMPAPLQVIASLMPFKWIVWFPSAALMGRLAWPEVGWGLLAQVAWLTGGIVVFRLAWPRAVRNYTAVGN